MNDLSDNLITIVNNPYSLKERNGFDLHDGICIPEKIKFLSSPLTTVVNFMITRIPSTKLELHIRCWISNFVLILGMLKIFAVASQFIVSMR